MSASSTSVNGGVNVYLSCFFHIDDTCCNYAQQLHPLSALESLFSLFSMVLKAFSMVLRLPAPKCSNILRKMRCQFYLDLRYHSDPLFIRNLLMSITDLSELVVDICSSTVSMRIKFTSISGSYELRSFQRFIQSLLVFH